MTVVPLRMVNVTVPSLGGPAVLMMVAAGLSLFILGHGAGAWCFSDYDPCLWHKPPFDSHEHERFFGLTRYDGTVKPSGEAMRACAERAAAGDLPPRTVGPLELDPNAWYLDAAGHFDRLFREWRGRI